MNNIDARIGQKLKQFLGYKLFTKNLVESRMRYKFINELCEIAELEFLSYIPREIGESKIATYLKNLCDKFNVNYDIEYLRRRWKKLFKTKVYIKIDNYVAREILCRDKNKCQYCNRKANLEIHHVIPKYKKYNGSNSYFNLVAACKKCNLEILNKIELPENWWKLHNDSHNSNVEIK